MLKYPVGTRFGRLVITARDKRRITCLCDCGKTVVVYYQNLRNGTTKSCGSNQARGTMRSSKPLICGLGYQDIITCAGMNQKEAAKRLGVNYNYFNQTMKRLAMTHWFDKPKGPPANKGKTCVSREDVIKVAEEGYIMKDGAYILGISECYMIMLVKRWSLRHMFPNCGKAAYISRRGYAN